MADAQTEKAPIVLTDAPMFARRSGCPTPQCKGQRVHASGFGTVTKEVCSDCGHVYGEVRIG